MATRKEILGAIGLVGLGAATAVSAGAVLGVGKQPAAIVSSSEGMPSGSPIGGIDIATPKPSEAVATPTPEPTPTPAPTNTTETDNSALVEQIVAALKASQDQNPNASTPVAASATPDATASVAPDTSIEVAANVQNALQNGDGWMLKDGDGKEMQISLPQGFTPDARLVMATNIKKGTVNSDLSVYKDWEKALNTGRPVGDRLAGYNYDYNDFCQTLDFECNVQADMYAWRIFQGETVSIPGIGTLEGGPRESVMVLFLNATPDVTAFDKDGMGQVLVKRGFTATGRSFDANPYSPKFQKEESGLLGHWLFRQAQGTPEKSYVGITNSPDNANKTLFAVVVKNQWGNNPDGSPRYQFQLLDAGIAQFNGTKVNITK